MVEFRQDSVNNAIYLGIMQGITIAMENECFGSAVILLYSAIDAMAYLGMPKAQSNVTKKDFVAWADQYIRFDGKEQLTGADLYGARCAMLHSYGVRSQMSHKAECRIIGYMSEAYPPVQYNSSVSKELVLVSVPALRDAVFKGVNDFLIRLYSNPEKGKLADERIKNFVHLVPFKELT